MNAVITLPDNLADIIKASLREEVEKQARVIAEEVEAGNRWVKINEAVRITGKTRQEITSAANTKQLAHYIEKGKKKFRLKDLWVWMDLKRVEAKHNL